MAFQDLLYLRQAEVIVGQKVSSTNSPIVPNIARRFRTRINFEVEQDNSSNANKAKINIYNLSQDSKTFLEQKDLILFLQVGYESTGFRTLFFGDIDSENGIHSKRQGPDIITTIEAGDSEVSLREANIQVGRAAGVTNVEIIEQAARKLLVSTSFKTDIREITFQNGFSYSGSVKKLLDVMGKQAGFEWSIQSGELLILGEDETDTQSAVLITPSSGLIDYPVKTQDKVEFKSLLNSDLRPGRAARIESQIFGDAIGANLKLNKVTFKGDTHEGEWSAKCEGKIL